MIAAVTICVRIAMSEVYFIVLIFKLYLESEGIIESATFLLKIVLIVSDLVSLSLPLLVCHRIQQRFHALIIRTLGLHHVDNVELVSDILPCIFNSEIKPLCVISCSVVVLEN